MRAIVQDVYGPPEKVLRLEDLGRPAVGDDHVLIRVHAAGVDPSVWHLMTGKPYLGRLMGLGLFRPKTRVRGSDVAGRVETVGKNVTAFRPGDEVFGTAPGSFAEYARARETNLVPKPSNVTFVEAAAVPVSATTALQGLRDVGGLKPGQTVLVIGAAGGVGSFAVQLAKALGAEVSGVCSSAKIDLVHSLGAGEVIDYTSDDFTDGRRRYDLILDTAGGRPFSRLRRALTPCGTIVVVGGEAGGRLFGPLGRMVRGAFLSRLARWDIRSFLAAIRRADLETLAEFLAAGQIRPVIDRTYPLEAASEAVRYSMGGHGRGKTVLTVPAHT